MRIVGRVRRRCGDRVSILMLIARQGAGAGAGRMAAEGRVAAAARRTWREQVSFGAVGMMVVVCRIIAGVEARPSTDAHGLLVGLVVVVVVLLLRMLLRMLRMLRMLRRMLRRMLLLLASYCILNRRNVAVAALVVSAKGHGANGQRGRAADAAGAKDKEGHPGPTIEESDESRSRSRLV